MEEIELKLTNKTPFCELSREFPDVTVFRWCSSVIDYVEIYGNEYRIKEAHSRLGEVTNAIHSRVLNSDLTEKHSESAISCRCTTSNSSIRLAESMNLLWEAPAIYFKGKESLRLVAFSQGDVERFINAASKDGTVQLVKKKKMLPDSLREIYSISLGDIFQNMSPKQVRYLRDAIAIGIFDSPRKTKIEDLAASNGLSKSTMQEHINKARNKLLHAMEPYITIYLHSGSQDP
jgi:predicted DNA binding protein